MSHPLLVKSSQELPSVGQDPSCPLQGVDIKSEDGEVYDGVCRTVPEVGYRWDASTFPADDLAERGRQVTQAVAFVALFFGAALIG